MRRSSPILFWGNLLVWGAVMALLIVYRGELAWAMHALPAQLLGEAQPRHEQWALYAEAARQWRSEGDSREVERLLGQSLAIEPNADPMLLLAEVLAERGETEQALGRLLRATEFDPYRLDAWLGTADLLEALGRERERVEVLERGVAWFDRAVSQQQPHPDGTVRALYNAKAEEVLQDLVEARDVLKANLRGSVAPTEAATESSAALSAT